ncbi:hypothetical protein J5U23_03171 [Saccharolobus shibatae B12]|uniref:Uncharacterized protein n=1 Tax=Saccharolobus shibatae (strain ATCC 51178 / DSM 5389 / JCM 8931 / NBRC 15437 / B12) TaxID=523848 RepID=A0A8F5BRT6_SACSH|nr:hypothetical protein J5U23_03171 [Saccharolobus shibatae B12]
MKYSNNNKKGHSEFYLIKKRELRQTTLDEFAKVKNNE